MRGAEAKAAPVSRGRALYVLALLSLVSLLNYYDRNLIGILVEDLKRDLVLTDTQIGLLSGLAFAVVYSVAGLPIARYADGGRRVSVLSLSLGFWSLMTGLCGLATGFWSMLAARFGVGLGEAGGLPTTHALVADHFSADTRARALSVIAVVAGLGTYVAIAGGGLIADRWGWRVAFWTGAVPGLILAIVLFATVREPKLAHAGQAADQPAIGMVTAIKILLKRRSFFWFNVGLASAAIGAYGAQVWMPAFLMRNYGLSAGEVGASYGMVSGLATIIGMLVGGIAGDRLSRRDPRWSMWILAISFGTAIPLTLIILLADDYDLVLIMAFVATLAAILYVSPAYALVQALSGPKFRATGAALFMLITNLLGLGVGPSLTGFLSDLLAPSFGDDSLKYALVIGLVTYLIGTLAFLHGARTVGADIAEANAD